MGDASLTTHQKALALNLDPATYGVFAEIGGGQEVARWFFSVGAAATGVAKAISAYDMALSDGLYGPGQRYVSRQRLEAMLEHEFVQLAQLVKPLCERDSPQIAQTASHLFVPSPHWLPEQLPLLDIN